MIIFKKKILKVLALVACLAITVASASFWVNQNAKASYEDAFQNSLESAPIKYKSYYSDVNVSEEKGLLLYSYDSGAKTSFKGKLDGVFTTQFKSLADEGKPADLQAVTFVFTENERKQSFSVTVEIGLESGQAYVTANGQNGGIYYANDKKCYGYTAIYNRDGKYTEFSVDGKTSLTFDPLSMQVNIAGGEDAPILVWDFLAEYNDGKKIETGYSPFNKYSVDVVFTRVKKSGKGKLLIYDFGGVKFNSRNAQSKATVSADFEAKAIVGKEYTAPKAEVSDVFNSNLTPTEVKLTVYNDKGEVVNGQGDYKVTFNEEGNYYFYYEYGSGEKVANAYYKLQAIAPSNITTTAHYEKEFNNITVGQNGKVYIPKAVIESNLFVKSLGEEGLVTVKVNGEVVDGYEKVAGGFEFKFSELGEYTVEYTSKNLDTVAQSFTVTVSEDLVGEDMAEIPQMLKLGEKLNITPAVFYKNGNEEIAKVTVIKPSGEKIDSAQIVLDELGYYTVTHTTESGILREQEFVVKESYSNLFTEGEGNSVNYKTSDLNNQLEGQMLSLKNNSTLVYDKIIDLSDNVLSNKAVDLVDGQGTKYGEKLVGVTQEDLLLDFIVEPSVVGTTDLTGLYFTITDVYDPNNYISFRFKYMDYNPNMVLLRTRASGQNWMAYYYRFNQHGMEIHNATSHEDGGYAMTSSFVQNIQAGHPVMDRSIKLYFDYDNYCLYATPLMQSSDYYDGNPMLVRDYGAIEQEFSGGDKPWRGFTTGEVKLSVYAVGVSDRANVLLLNVDGEDLKNEFISDITEPIIEVETEEIPKAEVGVEYPVFSFIARDLYSTVTQKDVKVYFGNAEVEIQDGKFTPLSTGIYTITYIAKDSYGNVQRKSVEVAAYDEVEDISIVFASEMKTTAVVGEKIYLPEFYGEGGAGGNSNSVRVTCQGQDVPVEYGAFVCEKVGNYTVMFTVVDHIGNRRTATRTISGVKVSDKPVFDENTIILPKAFISGDTFIFPKYVAYKYASETEKTEIPVKIEVTDGSGTNTVVDKYTPFATDSVTSATVRFIFNETVYERVVPIKKFKAEIGYLSNYFEVENGVVTAENEGVVFTADNGAENMKYSFLRMISVDNLYFRMKVDGENSSFDYFNVIYRDSENANKKVIVRVYKDGDDYFASVNGGKSKIVSVDDNGELRFVFNKKDNSLTDVFDKNIAIIEKYENQMAFDGFASGKVYVDVEVGGITGGARLSFVSIANQIMNTIRFDSGSPMITLEKDISGSFVPGTKITIPKATAYDVLNAVSDVTVTVTLNGEIIVPTCPANQERSFASTKYGEYAITYVATDAELNKMTIAKYVVIYDDVKPTLTLKKDIPTTVKRGKTLKLQKYTVSDNGDVSKVVVKIYYMTPDGEMHGVTGGEITFTAVGKHVILYYVQDENGNVKNYAFNVDVTK